MSGTDNMTAAASNTATEKLKVPVPNSHKTLEWIKF